MMVRMTTTTVVGRSAGQVTLRKTCHRPAPSTLAASMSSAGTAWRPARKSTMLKPTPCQTEAMKME